MTSDAELLKIQFQTGYKFDSLGRFVRTNDPDHSAAPKFGLSGYASGNLAGVRADVTDDIALELLALAASEPPFVDRTGAPQHIARYIELLSRDGPTPRTRLGVSYVLPNDLVFKHHMQLVCSESDKGKRLHDTLADQGMPSGLKALGFVDVSHFWEPWCAALQDGEVVSVAFAARLSETGAGLGLATAPAFRGRGYAAAATAGWARMPALRSRALFYSTSRTNASSQRVVERLGLRFFGSSLELS